MDRDEMIRSWEAKTGLEKILIMVCFVFCVMILGFMVGVAALKATERGNENQIKRLRRILEECEANLPNRNSTTTTTTTPVINILNFNTTKTTSAPPTTKTSSGKIFNSFLSPEPAGYLTSSMYRA